MTEEMGFFEAYHGTWTPLVNAAGLLDLLARLEPTGVLRSMREPMTADTFAEAAGLDGATARAALHVLELFDVVHAEGPGHRLTPPWRALTRPGGFQTIGALLEGQQVGSRIRRHLGQLDYWELSPDERIRMARMVSPDPYSDELVDGFRRGLAKDALGQAVLRGGRYLELGCGVAGRILLTLRAAPELTAVGVELTADLAEEAERRAAELGLSDRFTVVCGDAAEFVADEPFDFGFWSQFFFPDHARGPALATMFGALRPGGVIQAPVGADAAAAAANPDLARGDALWSTALRAWGVPARSIEDLQGELTAAGFVDVEAFARDAGPAIRGVRP